MTSGTCPNGHVSESSDYCDMCGAPMDQSPPPSVGGQSASSAPVASSGAAEASHASTTSPCPNCMLVNTVDALFCEGCGYDFTTGTMPRPAAPANSLDLGSAPAGGSTPAGGPTPGGGSAPAGGSVPDSASPAGAPTAPISTAPSVEVEWVAEVWVDPDWYAEQDSEEPCPSPGLPVVVPLRTQSLLVGRRSRSRNIHPEIECQSDVGVSRRHAQLTSDGQRWWVEDLQSANGTFVGPASDPLPTDALPPGQRRELALDDHIYVGAWTCIVVRRATPEEQTEQA